MRFPLTLVYCLAALVSLIAALVLLRRREMPAAIWLALMIMSAGIWALMDAVELQAFTPAGKRLASQIQYIGIVTAAPCFFHAAFVLARLQHRISMFVKVLVWAIPMITLPIAWTAAHHSLLWTSITIPDPASNLGVYHYGPWFWIFAFHSYAVLAVGTVVVLLATRRVAPPFRIPFSALLIAVALPWFGNIAYNLKLGPLPGLNWFSISITFCGVMLAYAASRQGLLDLLPQARETLVAGMQDGVIVCDLNNRILYANSAAHSQLWPRAAPQRLISLLLTTPDAVTRSWQDEVQLEDRWFDVRVDPVLDRWNEPAGCVVVLRDITARKSLQLERESLITELENALSMVRKLEGILPICSGCRNIREADGSWMRLDRYVSRHADVQFSHGLCPDCVARLYGSSQG